MQSLVTRSISPRGNPFPSRKEMPRGGALPLCWSGVCSLAQVPQKNSNRTVWSSSSSRSLSRSVSVSPVRRGFVVLATLDVNANAAESRNGTSDDTETRFCEDSSTLSSGPNARRSDEASTYRPIEANLNNSSNEAHDLRPTEATNVHRPRFAVTQGHVGRGSRLVGSGSAVPKHVISNDDLSKFVDTSDEWIAARTGIRNRRVLGEDESLTSLSVEASRNALEMANVRAEEVDLVLLCTSTPDDLFGSAPQVQTLLGCHNALAFDLTAACSGFVLGLVTATRFIRGGGYKNVLIVGADALSRYVDWTDRGTCILFGDAAGALLLQAATDDQDSLLGFDLRSDGKGQKHLHVKVENVADPSPSGGETNGAAIKKPGRASYECLQMNGQEVFRFAVRAVPQVVEGALLEAGLTGENIDWLLLHQANQRILDSVSDRLRIPSEKVISNLANYGNTSAASIPLALDEAVRSGKVKVGDVVATAGFGAGLTWGSAIVKWG